MKTYEVTIGIPVYNVEKYIRQTMDSALSQTFESIEFLICDDCGTDTSISIVEEYQKTHPRGKDIRILPQPHNMGIGEARNRMIEASQGRYFYSLDADDIISKNAIELLHGAAQKYQAEIVYGSYERLYVNGEKKRTEQYPYPFKVFTEPDKYAEYVYRVGIQGMNWNYLIDIDIIRRNHLRVTPVGHGYGEDFTFTVDLPTYITRAVLLPDITYQYYINEKDFTGRRKKVINRPQMDIAIATLEKKKWRKELKGKPYYSMFCSKIMMYEFSFACQIAKRKGEPTPPYSNKEISDMLKFPMTLKEILHSKQRRKNNLFYYVLGVLPSTLSVLLLRLYAKWFLDKDKKVV